VLDVISSLICGSSRGEDVKVDKRYRFFRTVFLVLLRMQCPIYASVVFISKALNAL